MTAGRAVGRAAVDVELGQWLERALGQAVRTPLHSLLGFLELFGMTRLDGEQRRLMDQLVGSAEDLLAGSDRVLWLVRLVGDEYRPRPRRVDLAEFAAEVAAASDGAVSPVVAADAPRQMDVDLPALHQLVRELVANALAHGAAPVVLAVSPVPGRRDRVRITVSDGGAGLLPAARRDLGARIAGEDPATGLGSLLVNRLAGLLGGTVQVLPTHMGTSIALTLPVTVAPSTPAAPAPVAPTPVEPPRPLRVLLVEDNATNRLLTERQLARLGHSLVAVATGEAGVRAALEEEVDVVLMDRHLPDIDGCEATRRISAGLPVWRPYLPIIAVTADATAEAREACAAAGMDEVLTKPVDLERLGAALARAAAAIDRGDGLVRHGGDGPGGSGAAVPPALHAVIARVDGDATAAAELVSTYLGELPGRRLRIQASLRRGEPRAVLAAAESLRTSSDTIGATAVSGACAAIGGAAAAADLAAARSFLPSLMVQCERFTAELAGFSDPAAVSAVLSGAER